MSKNNENKLVPRLRFPEFRNESWKDSELSKLGKTINGLNGKSSEDFGTGKPFVTYKQVFDSAKVDLSKCGRVVIKENENQNTLLKGDILFTTSSETPHEVGYTSVVLNEPNEPTYLNSFCFSFRPFSLKQLQPEFSQYLFHSPTYRKSIGVLAQGITRFNISKGAFLKIKVPLPKNPIEQQKIAACLSSLDDVITAESKKLEVLKEHKKGLLQNLFPQEGETVPKLRFKEFVGNWENVQLGSLIEIKGRIGYRGYTTNDIVEKGQGAITFSPSNIDDNNQLNFNKATYISWDKYFESPEIMLQDGYTVLVKTGSSFGKAVFIKNLPEKTTINPQLVVLKPININPKFLFLLVCNSAIQRQIKETVVGGAIPTLSQESISRFEILIPPDNNKKEQQKIAACLSSIDDLINAQSQK
jgi:type I restriction enzyme S subunit